MNNRIIVLLIIFGFLSGCASYPADRLLEVKKSANNEERTITKANEFAGDLLEALKIPEGRNKLLSKLNPDKIEKFNSKKEYITVVNKVVIVDKTFMIDYVADSIVIANVPLEIGTSINSVIISSKDISIHEDGIYRPGNKKPNIIKGSAIISKGRVKVSQANESLIYSLKGFLVPESGKKVYGINCELLEMNGFGVIKHYFVNPIFENEKPFPEKLKKELLSGARYVKSISMPPSR